MRRLLLSLTICSLGLTAWGGCRSPRHNESADALAAAARLISQGQDAEHTSYATAAQLYQDAIQQIETLAAQPSAAPLWDSILHNQEKIGPYTLQELQEQILPQAQQKAEAESDPLACALFLAQQSDQAEEKAGVLAEVADAYASLGQKEKIAAIVRDSGSAIYGLLSAVFERSFSKGQGEEAWALAQALEDVEVKDWALAWIARRYLEQERLEDALRAAEPIEDAATKAEELLALADKYAGSTLLSPEQQTKAVDLLEQADKLVAEVGERALKKDLLDALSRSYAAAGQYARALEIAETLNPVERRAKTLIALARSYGESGQQEAAITLLHQAARLGETVVDPRDRTGVLKEAARAYLTMGQDAAAIRIADGFRDPLARAEVLTTTIQQYAADGKYQSALQLARRIPDPNARNRALAGIARAYAAAGRTEEAKAVTAQIGQDLPAIVRQYVTEGQYEQAQQVAAVIPDAEARATTLAEVATRCFAEREEVQGATALAAALQAADADRDPRRRDPVRIKIARLLMEAQQYEPARQVVETLSDAPLRTTVLAELARNLFGMGNDERGAALLAAALQTSQTIVAPRIRVKILESVARQLNAQGRAAHALEVTALIDDARARATLLRDIAVSAAEGGRYEEAVRLAQAIPRMNDRARALSAITRRALAEERYDLAQQYALLMPPSGEREQALAALSHRYLAQGRYQEAAVLMEFLQPSPLKTRVMTETAAAYLTSGEEARVARLLKDMRDMPARDEVLAAVARWYVAEGQRDRALQAARAIGGVGTRARVLRALMRSETQEGTEESSTPRATLHAKVRTLAGAGRCEDARQTAETEGDARKRATLLVMATRRCFESGRQTDGESLVRATLAAITTIPDAVGRTRAFVSLAKGMLAEKQFPQALEIVKTIADRDAQAEILAVLAQAYLDAGQEDRAVAIARTIPEADGVLRLFAALVRKHLEANRVDQAMELTASIVNPYIKGGLFVKIAAAYVERGLPERAPTVLRQALRSAAAVQQADRNELLAAIATIFFSSGNLEQALMSAQQIEDLQARAAVLATLASKSLEGGRLSETERIAEAMMDQKLRDETLMGLADQYLTQGNYDRAFASAEHIAEPRRRTVAMAKLARSELDSLPGSNEQTVLGFQTSAPLREAQQGEESREADDEIASLVLEYVKKGRRARASELLAQQESSAAKARLLAEIAHGYAAAGDQTLATEVFKSALQEVGNLTQSSAKERALVQIGVLYAKSGVPPDDGVRKWLRMILENVEILKSANIF